MVDNQNRMVQIPVDVAERVHMELVRTITETPEYVAGLIKELLEEKPSDSRLSYDDPDRNKNYFERLLRQKLRVMIDRAMTEVLRDRYQEPITTAVGEAVDRQEKLEGTLANAFSRLVAQDYKINVDVKFEFKKD